ncbi:hypothetical protein [Polaribacter sargassicola]|uniref:hypothetical protein n=1 Tax=Polaribacter sargassicola TaxID=2836891 RepID=UPI001F21AAB3|nr:hypothetical protein [Polaribacter sp. DS7-9]MCG1035524.1 hypothetical protein [Polaribacter sp. DS7-9]
MIFNTSHTNQKFTEESNDILGKAFSLFEKIKMGGVGSSRFVVKEWSAHLLPNKLQKVAMHYANIELRPKGIMVHFTNGLERYSWIITYYRLVVYNAQTFSIHADGHFIKFRKNKNYQNNKKFINKMIDCKNIFLNLSYYDG